MTYIERLNIHGFLIKRWTNNEGLLHREDGPAEITYYENGSIMSKNFYFNGNLHNPLGPCSVHYYADGSRLAEAFYFEGYYLGQDNGGFWRFWERLTDEQRRHPDILKCLAVYS